MEQNYYEYRHVVGFEETNIVGNVYYVNYLRWQGRCREMFLREKASAVLEDLLDQLTSTQIQFSFDYVKVGGDGETLVATGKQRIVCMRGPNTNTVPTRVPM